jgi:uncharacterized protein (TIGR02145 family)
MSFITQQGRALLLTAVLVVGSACVLGCGGNKDASSGKSEQGAASGKSGKLTDSRDGQKYKTVKIGNQVWMAENLRFKIGDSWCYNNSEDNCAKYGRLYDWDVAKIACPKGWHLPSKDEWTELVTVVGSETGGKKLKSANGWYENGNGTDEFGFSALPGGLRYTDGSFYGVGKYGLWWTATERGGGIAYSRLMGYDEDDVYENDTVKGKGFSVRCLQDN